MINTSDITNQSSKDSEKINLSSSIQEQKPFVKPPPIQNLNNLIMSCVKNDEYCYSMFDYLKKMIYFRQIDYLFAYTNILYCFRPKEINEMAKVRKHLKNKYARDDPGFLLIIIINLFISSIAFSFAFNHTNPFFIFNIFFIQTFVMLFTFGLGIAMVSKFVIDKFFKSDELGINREQNIEYVYAFDIHCNAFVTLYFFCAVIPYIILPIVNGYKLFQVIIANTLLCIGVLYYCYVTFMGYFSLPFVRKNKFVTLAVWPVIATFVIATVLRVNIFANFVYWIYGN